MKTNYVQASAFLLFASLSSVCQGLQGLTPAKRDQVVLGWALVEDLCPPGNAVCGERSCCPVGSYCDDTENTNSNLCCPTSDPCGYVNSKAPKCAVDTWVMWETTKDPICCEPGEIGVQPSADEDYGHCVSAGASIAAGMTATMVSGTSTASNSAATAGTSSSTGAGASATNSNSAGATTQSSGASTAAATTASSSTSSSTSSPASTSKSGSEHVGDHRGGASLLMGIAAALGAVLM